MKKILLLLLIAVFCMPFLASPLWAEDEPIAETDAWDTGELDEFREYALNATGSPPNEEKPGEYTAAGNTFTAGQKAPSPAQEAPRTKNRGFEFGLAGARVGASNNFLATKDVFKETAVIDLDEFTKGFKLNVGLDITPLWFKVNRKDEWGFGLEIARIEGTGNIDISGTMLKLQLADKEKFGVGAAAFVDFGIPAFFYIRDFKVKIRPAGFITLAYVVPNFTYTFKDGSNGMFLELNYDMNVYTAISLEANDPIKTYKARALGFDFSAGAEYPLLPQLDLGVDIKNIPFIPSTLSYSMQIKDRVSVDTSKINFNDVMKGEKIPDDALHTPDGFEPVHGAGNKKVLRPFKMVFNADYRPFNKPLFSLIPLLGFAINPVYVKPASLEAVIKARVNLANMFFATIGIGYEDRVWKNGIDLALDLRAFELDIGGSLQAPNFAKSWGGAGAGVNVGFKFGW
jgi:hypothetical protein